MKDYSFFSSFILLSLLASSYVTAQQAAPTNYEGETKEASSEIQEKFENAVVPISNSLAYLLTKALPEADGNPRPLGIMIEPADPADPHEPVQIVFHCAFGGDVCEPFFRACAALHLKCTGG